MNTHRPRDAQPLAERDLHDYQRFCVEFIEAHPQCGVFLDMGLGKTAIALTAVSHLLYDSFEVSRVLIIAPLRVARDTWPAEIQKWDHLKGLTYSVAVGTEAERRSALQKNTLIHIINRENVQWLIEQSGLPFQYDMLVIDELSSFKSHQAKRFRALMRMRPRVARVVGLTGTPSSNGLMDLWAEFRLLDMGRRLGKFITHYREAFFLPDRRSAQQVFSWKPKPGAEDEIYRRISDSTISMKNVLQQISAHISGTLSILSISAGRINNYTDKVEVFAMMFIELFDGTIVLHAISFNSFNSIPTNQCTVQCFIRIDNGWESIGHSSTIEESIRAAFVVELRSIGLEAVSNTWQRRIHGFANFRFKYFNVIRFHFKACFG